MKIIRAKRSKRTIFEEDPFISFEDLQRDDNVDNEAWDETKRDKIYAVVSKEIQKLCDAIESVNTTGLD